MQLPLKILFFIAIACLIQYTTFKYLIKQNLFLISFQPLFIILAVKFFVEIGYDGKSKLDFFSILNILFTKSNYWWYYILIYLAIIPVIILFLRNFFTKNKSNERAKKFTTIRENIVSYFMTYIVPLTTLSVHSKLSNVIVNIILFIVVMVLYIRLDLTYLNPILIFFGFNIYKIYTVQPNGKNYKEERVKYIISKKNEDKFGRLFKNEKPVFEVHSLGGDLLMEFKVINSDEWVLFPYKNFDN